MVQVNLSFWKQHGSCWYLVIRFRSSFQDNIAILKRNPQQSITTLLVMQICHLYFNKRMLLGIEPEMLKHGWSQMIYMCKWSSGPLCVQTLTSLRMYGENIWKRLPVIMPPTKLVQYRVCIVHGERSPQTTDIYCASPCQEVCELLSEVMDFQLNIDIFMSWLNYMPY